MSAWLRTITLAILTLGAVTTPATPAPQPRVATPAPPELITELRPIVERARQRFEARDAGGVLANVSEQYRSAGMTKAGLREQLLSMFALYDTMRVRLSVVGWMRVLTWQNEPEVARREGTAWRLFGFQD